MLIELGRAMLFPQPAQELLGAGAIPGAGGWRVVRTVQFFRDFEDVGRTEFTRFEATRNFDDGFGCREFVTAAL